MAMLAEPRRRQKWSLNPRGTDWANDDSKFGQKVMEKMGWTKGKGLGREEQGMKEHLSVKLKDDTKGLGYQGKDDEWIKHYEGFENVLAMLNSEENSAANLKKVSTNNIAMNSDDEDVCQKSFKSLETLSKTSRARVHYHKFTRGKDLSRYNEDDIGCILGSKRAKIMTDAAAQVEVGLGEEAGDDEKGHIDHLNGITTIKGGNVQEYFAEKLKALKMKSEKEQHADIKENEDKPEDTVSTRPAFGGWCDERNADDIGYLQDQTTYPSKKKKKQSDNKNGMENIHLGLVESGCTAVNSKKCDYEKDYMEEKGFENGIKKKKKKKKYDELKDVAGGSDMPGYASREVGTETKEKKKRKNQKYTKDEIKMIEEEGHEVNARIWKKTKEALLEGHSKGSFEFSCTSKKDKKRKKKDLETGENDGFSENAFADDQVSHKYDKKKKRGDKNLLIGESHAEGTYSTVCSKKHKKKKKTNTVVEDSSGSASASIHCKKERKKLKESEEKTHFNDSNSKQFIDHEMDGVNMKKLKKKKKSSDDSEA